MWAAYVNGHRPKDYAGELTHPGDLFGYDRDEEPTHELTEEQTQKQLEAFVRRFNASKRKANGQSKRAKK